MRFLDRDHDPRTSSGPRSVQTAKSRPDTCEHSTGVHSCRNQALTEGVSTHDSRGMRAPRAGEESRRPAIAGSRPATRAKQGERIAALDPPAPGRRGAAVPSRQGEPWFRRLPPPRRRPPLTPPARGAARKLEMRDRAEDLEYQLAGGRVGADPLLQAERVSRAMPRSLSSPPSAKTAATTCAESSLTCGGRPRAA